MHAWLLVFHVLGFVMWVGGLMLVSRLLGWHAQQTPEVQAPVGVMLKRLYYAVAVPGSVLTLVAGLLMLNEYGWAPLDAKLEGAGFHIKLTLVFGLIVLDVMTYLGVTRLASGQVTPKGKAMAIHGLVGLLLIGILVTIFVVRPGMKQKKADERAAKAAIEAGAR